MKIERIPIRQVKPNPDNPRIIRDEKYHKLLKSLEEFPEMAEARPLVIDPDGVVLGGNMRLRAMQELKWKTVPVIRVTWEEARRREFTIKDNVGFGEWDWDVLANEWEIEELAEWGLDIPGFEFEAGGGDGFTLGDGDEPKSKTVTVILSAEQHERYMEALGWITDNSVDEKYPDYGNLNKAGNALHALICEWEKLSNKRIPH